MSQHMKKRKVAATVGAVLLAVGLASCAPESGDVAGSTDKDTQTINPESEASEREVTEYEYSTEVPESFPSEEFALPEGSVVQDIGETGVDQWFVVLLAPSTEAADAWWNEVIESNGFGVADETETSEGGRYASLNGINLQIEALTIPQSDGSVQLSYSLVRWA